MIGRVRPSRCNFPKPWPMVLLLLFLPAAGCSLSQPSAPSWDVVFNLPLFNRSFDLAELLKDSDLKPVGPDSIYAISINENLERVEVGGDIELDGFDERLTQQIGALTVPGGETHEASLSLEAMTGLSPPTGVAFAFPSMSFPPTSVDLPELDRFEQVVIESGELTLRVENRTRVTLDTLVVELLDLADGETLVREVDITDGGTDPLLATPGQNVRVMTIPLDGITLSNSLRLRARGHIVGDEITLDGSEELVLEVQASALTVASVTGDVDPIEFEYSERVELADASVIDYAVFSQGTLALSILNQLGVPLELEVILPNLTDAGGAPVILQMQVGAGESGARTRDLAGYRIEPDPIDQTLSVEISVFSPGGTGVTLAATDQVEVQAVVSNLVISEVSGELEPTTIEIDPDTIELDTGDGNLWEELRKIQLREVDLILTIQSTIGFPASGTVTMIGRGGSPDPVVLPLEFDIAPGHPDQPPTVTVVDLSSDVFPQLLTFLNAFPAEIEYEGSFTVGAAGYVGTVRSDSWVEVAFEFSTPLLFDVTEPILFETEASFSEEGIESSDEIAEVTLFYTLSSTLGLPLRVELLTASDSISVFSNPDVRLALKIAPSQQEAVADTTLSILRSDWDRLAGPIWTGVAVRIEPTAPGTPFRVSKNDRLHARANLRVAARVEPGKNGNGGGR